MSSASSSNEEHARAPRCLILCFDGTTNEYAGDNTNVVEFFSLLKKDDFEQQLCYYQAGVGTYLQPGIVSPLFQWGAKILDEAVAWYLNAHVMDGYRFLMQNYRVGDRICIFGFSRGAYTARALGGMLYKVGLLPKDNQEQINFAYKLYQRTDKAGITLAKGFKRTFSQNVNVEFMGVWDTVASVGVIMSKNLPFTDSNTSIKTFRHALSLDEHRAKFRPNYYHRPAPSAAAAAKDPNHSSPVTRTTARASSVQPESETQKLLEARAGFFRRKSKQIAEAVALWEAPEEEVEGPPTDVLEVWFSGCHSDIGGGAVANDVRLSLARITLRWMVREVMAAQCGIQFDTGALARCGIPVETFPPATSRTAGPEELARDADDALQPLHDPLVQLPIWWLLEVVPLFFSYQDAQGVWHREFSFHLGRGRYIPDPNPKFHVTVKERMAAAALKYKPKARWTPGTQTFVE